MALLDATDVQGFALRGYTYPVARFLFLELAGGNASLHLIDAWPAYHDRGEWAGTKPDTTVNIAFTYRGLSKLSLPLETLQSFPVEFVQGMRARSDILNDTGRNAPENWDKLWLDGKCTCGWQSTASPRIC